MDRRPRTASLPPAPWAALLLPLVAAIFVVPLIIYGPSCGHDYGFHMQSWMEAAAQLKQGHLLPRWTFSPAYNAGEPRFIFYPPLSWLVGALLTILLPAAAVSTAFTWLVLAAAAVAMYALARRFATPTGALLAAVLYIANPYVLFTAYERSAYAELLAAVWMPLLLRAVLADQQISIPAVALPVALLWLTNAPAAVMGTYTLVTLALIRAALLFLRLRHTPASASSPAPNPALATLKTLLLPAAGGLVLGLALAGFYLLPAAWERRYVQIAMAIIPNMRVEDNFLFGHTGYGPHDQILHTASLVALCTVALCTVALTAAALALAAIRNHLRPSAPSAPENSSPNLASSTLIALSLLGAAIAALLWHFTQPIWLFLPELRFLQFPWRLLSVLGCVFGLGAALALRSFRLPLLLTAALLVLIAAGATHLALAPFRQGCEATELLPSRLGRFRALYGVGPTDEYTPLDADNDQLRWDDPAWWLASTPDAPGPGTVPNPASTIEDYDQPPPLEQTLSGRAPRHLALHLTRPQILILNLRAYPTWTISVNGNRHPAYRQRDDGLLAVDLPAGSDTVDVRWRTLPDMWAGDALTLVALGVLAGLRRRSRRIVH